MSKKHKRDQADEFDVTVGEVVLFRGNQRIITSIRGTDTGNLPRVTMAGEHGSYSVTYVKKIKRD